MNTKRDQKLFSRSHTTPIIDDSLESISSPTANPNQILKMKREIEELKMLVTSLSRQNEDLTKNSDNDKKEILSLNQEVSKLKTEIKFLQEKASKQAFYLQEMIRRNGSQQTINKSQTENIRGFLLGTFGITMDANAKNWINLKVLRLLRKNRTVL